MPIPLGVLAVAGAGGGVIASNTYELLETVNVSSAVSSVSFSNLNNYSDYKHLQIRAVAKSSSSGDDWLITFNGSSSNYAKHQLTGAGGAPTSSAATSAANINLTNGISQAVNSDAFSGTIIDILDFSSTSKNKTLRAFSGRAENASQIALFSGLWADTAAITSITLGITASNNIAANSRISLYGLRSA